MKRKKMYLILLALSGGIIYQLPFMRLMFYRPLLDAMKLSDGQYGIISSAYGLSSVIAYFFGGYIADKYSPKNLLSISLISTGFIGFYLSSFPSYKINLILHILLGFTTVLTYWAPMIKLVGLLGDSNEQGRIYGAIEGGRGITSALAGFIVLQIYKTFGEGSLSVSKIIIFYSFASILCGLLILYFFENVKIEISKNKISKISSKEIGKALKNKVTWYIGIIIFTTYVIFSAQGYLSPYLQDVYGLGVNTTILLGIIRTYVFQFLGGPFGGVLADNLLNSSTKFIKFGCISIICFLLSFLIIPISSTYVSIVIILMLLMSLIVYSMRGVYWAIIDEIGVPKNIRGTIIGVASFIGFSPDIFLPALIGNWLDIYPGNRGYLYMFTFMLIMMVVGLIFSIKTLALKNKISNEELDKIPDSI
ncbi:MAG: MFS transporter [Cetobacterium sp.]